MKYGVLELVLSSYQNGMQRRIQNALIEDWIPAPKGNSIMAKRAFAEFWESVEFLRILLGPPDDVTASFRISFLNVLSMTEQISFQETRRSIVWVGSDAAMIRCGAIDVTDKI